MLGIHAVNETWVRGLIRTARNMAQSDVLYFGDALLQRIER